MPAPTSLPAVHRSLLRDRVADRIRTAILNGTLEPGERLHYDQLISWLSVSRTPIRDALTSLADEGLIEMAANRYTRVALPDPAETLDALHTLGVLFGGAVRLTVPTLTTNNRRTTIKRLADEITQVSEHGTASVIGSVERSYQAWLDLCPNTMLVATAQRVVSGLAYKLRVPTIGDIVPADHFTASLQQLATAITGNDPIAAELAIEAVHMLDTIEPTPAAPTPSNSTKPAPRLASTRKIASPTIIRAWAAANGYDVAARGRLPKAVVAAYKASRRA